MAGYELSERELRARAGADRLNAILSQSSIKEGSENAHLRGREQAQNRLLAQKQAQDNMELEAALGIRQSEGQLNRDAALQRTRELTAAQIKGLEGGLASLGNIETAEEAGQTVIDEGGEFKGPADWAIGLMRDMGWNTVPNILADVAYEPTEKAARGTIVDATEQIRRALAGANLTGVEIGLQADSAPDAPGITMEESLRRLASWREKSTRALNAIGSSSGVNTAQGSPAPAPAATVVDFNSLK